jgi:transposase
MRIMLNELANRYSNNLLLIIYDGASSHKIEGIAENIIIKHLPPYSPQLNPQENIWDDMREKFFHNIAFDSMTAVENKLGDACLYYENNPATVYSITAWNWILNC